MLFSHKFAVFLAAALLALFPSAGSAGEFSTSSNQVGVANSYGELFFTGHLGTVHLSPSEEKPLLYQFTSQPGRSSPLLGAHFFLPLAESELIDHDWYLERTTLGGAVHFLYQSAADPETYTSLDTLEKAERKGSKDFTVTSSEGYELQYSKGRLQRFTTPQGTRITLSYEGDYCRRITSDKGMNVLSFEFDNDRSLLIRTRAGDFHVTFQDLPGTDAQDPASTSTSTVRTITWPDGARTAFNYTADTANGQTTLEMSYGDRSVPYTWESTRGQLKKAGDVTYSINPLFRFVPSEGKRADEHVDAGTYLIRREYPDNTSAVYFSDEDRGMTQETTRENVTTQSWFITARCPAHNKVRLRERQQSGGGYQTVYEAFYDTQGRLIRADTEGVVTYRTYPGMNFDRSVLHPGDKLEECDDKGNVLRTIAAGQ